MTLMALLLYSAAHTVHVTAEICVCVCVCMCVRWLLYDRQASHNIHISS